MISLLVLVGSKRLNLNQIWASKYPITGIDVSHYQGSIDWKKIKEQKVDFAFIKATEGSGHIDKRFQENWKHAQEAGIYIGAYHFFSFDSPASSQAELYIQTVGELSGKVIPIIDMEYYADKEINPPDKEQVIRSLKELLDILEEQYGQKPMIYTTYKFYNHYIKYEFEEYPLWIRNVYYPPIDIERKWQFWQYSDQGKFEGMQGVESNVDCNVFFGNKEMFLQFLVP